VDADVLEVEVDKANGDEEVREGRRAKIWSGIVGSQMNAPYMDTQGIMEEGEIHPDVLRSAQTAVLGLHGLLQERVCRYIGSSSVTAAAQMNVATGQATLASIIARAQTQSTGGRADTGSGSISTAQISAMAGTDANLSTSDIAEVPPGEIQNISSAGVGGDFSTSMAPLSLYGLSDEQKKLLEQAIANAASAAQLQAEAEAALEEEEDEDGYDDEGEEELDSEEVS